MIWNILQLQHFWDWLLWCVTSGWVGEALASIDSLATESDRKTDPQEDLLSPAGNSPVRSPYLAVATVGPCRKCNLVLTQWNMHITGRNAITALILPTLFYSWHEINFVMYLGRGIICGVAKSYLVFESSKRNLPKSISIHGSIFVNSYWL